MLRRMSSLVLTAGLAATCAGAAAFAIHVAVLDPGRARASGRAVLHAGPAKRAVAEHLDAALREQVPGAAGLTAAQLRDVTAAVERDPRFVAAFSDAVVAVQRHVFDRGPGLVVVQPTAVAAAVRDALAERASDIAPNLPPGAELNIELDVRSVPDLQAVGRGIDRAVLGLLAGAAAIAVALAGARPRRRAVARTARCCVGIGLADVVVFGALPRFVLWAFGPWPEVAGAYLRATTTPIVIVGVALLVAGAVSMSLVHRLELAAGRLARRHALAELARRTEWRPPPVERTPQRSG
ncbi:MAG: hypothetical protein JOZ99_07550 [Actinobacteria bacterium]|nr:hypothetical protein [Actinomycetota bacterium]